MEATTSAFPCAGGAGVASWPMQARPDPLVPLAFVREPDGVPARNVGDGPDSAAGGAVPVDGIDPPAVPDVVAPSPDSDEALMNAFATGDAEAFTRLYDRHERATWRFIRHRLGALHEAAVDDVLQETWISVARAASRYVATARFTTWLFTVARSRVIDHLRSQAHAAISLDAPLAPADSSGDGDGGEEHWIERLPAAAADGPLARIESREQAQAFVDALAQLPAAQREAFLLQAEGGLSVDEIASATGVGGETAKTRLRYAKARLRTLLAAWRPT
jgi:RNA polymerase sigma factor (sigma-70 family)